MRLIFISGRVCLISIETFVNRTYGISCPISPISSIWFMSNNPKHMPAPQLPNFPISPDDPFQSDPDLLPPIGSKPERDPAPGGQTSGNHGGHDPKPVNPDNPGDEPDDKSQ